MIQKNLWLGLSANRMNSYSNMNNTHSTWPVVLTIYNLPSWLCMKHKFLIISLLISALRPLENDIDVYLASIIEDLKIMWEEKVEVFDAYCQELFTFRAMLLWIINNFPAYSNLSGYSMKGRKACPISADDTFSVKLRHERKTVYLGNWRPVSHRYQRLRKAFNGFTEKERALKALNSQ